VPTSTWKERRWNATGIQLSELEASGGEQPHIVRWVLVISLLLTVALLSAIWIIGALTL